MGGREIIGPLGPLSFPSIDSGGSPLEIVTVVHFSNQF